MKRLLQLLWVSMLVFTPGVAGAVDVDLRLPPNLTVNADFRPGKIPSVAVILIHGFLQTRNYPTVTRLADGLADAGYTVLVPTLSLDVSNRVRSLPCEALHSHSMGADLSEIDAWIGWLGRKGYRQIVLVGHSFGAQQALAYAARQPSPLLRKVIALSLVDADSAMAADKREILIRDARRKTARHQKLMTGELGYCKNYLTTPEGYLSYVEWTSTRILDAVSHLAVPLDVIAGGADDRMRPEWLSKLRARKANVKIIPGANHFFDAQHEFDLLDAVLSGLPSVR